jgi:hypothetical protein
MFLSINNDTFKCNHAKRNEETKEGQSDKTLTTKVKACTTKKMDNNLQYPKDVGSSYPQLDLSKFFSCMFQLFVYGMLSKVQGLLYCASVSNPIVTTFFIVLSDWLQISTYLQGVLHMVLSYGKLMFYPPSCTNVWNLNHMGFKVLPLELPNLHGLVLLCGNCSFQYRNQKLIKHTSKIIVGEIKTNISSRFTIMVRGMLFCEHVTMSSEHEL